MSREYKLDFDGQSVTQIDYNDFASSAGLVGEKILAELFRLVPNSGTVARGIIPYGYNGSGQKALVYPNGATGTIKVNPFRAILGTRVTESTDAAKNWQDIRSGISIADGASTLATTLALTANASGNSRWDGIYAAVTVDSPSTPVNRKVKNPATALVTDQTVSTYKVVSVSVIKVDGTPGASPAFPTTPADSGNIYYIALAYVRVPNGFGAGSTVSSKDVNTIAPVVNLSVVTGVSRLRPANSHNVSTGAAITGSGTSPGNGAYKWTGTAASRAALYIPPTMVGGDAVFAFLDLSDASSANWSHQTGDIIDNSVDWRGRAFKWQLMAYDNNGPTAWGHPATANFLPSGTLASPGVAQGVTYHQAQQVGLGQSFSDDFGAPGKAFVCLIQGGTNFPTAVCANLAGFEIYVDTATGEMKIAIQNVPGCNFFVWIEATAKFENV